MYIPKPRPLIIAVGRQLLRNGFHSIEWGMLTASVQPSRPGELHPEPLTEPDVNLSTYPARATA